LITARQGWRKTVRHHSARDGELGRVQSEAEERFLAVPACGRQARKEDNFFPTFDIAVVGIKLQMF
jgi:hypothetical protein